MIDKRTLLALAGATLLSACATKPAPKSIADTVASQPQLSTLSGLIAQAGLADTLRGVGPFTLFAPSDDAFRAVPVKTMSELATDKEMLRSVLTFHVIPGNVASAALESGPAKTVQGGTVTVSRSGSFLTVDDAVVIQPDLRASNGVVHIVDRVLIPPKR